MALVDVAIAAFLGVVALVCLYFGLKLLRSAVGYFGLTRRLSGDDADPVDVAAVTQGRAAVEGTARPADEGTVPLPFSQGDALVSVGSTLKRTQSPESGTQRTTDEQATETVPFVVEDATGSIRVEPDDSVYHGREERFAPEEVDQSALTAWLGRTDVTAESDVGYKQQVIEPGDTVYVFGDVATDGGSSKLVDDGELVVSATGRHQVGGASVVSGLVSLFFGGLLLFFALSALSIAAAFLL